MGVDDVDNDREPKSSSVWSGREAMLEDVISFLRRNPSAIVFDEKPDVITLWLGFTD
jgi:hypothetical protein